MLDPFSRGAIVALTALCAAGAVALAPLRARSSIDGQHLHAAVLPAQSTEPAIAELAIVRDPFSEPTAAVSRPISASPVPEGDFLRRRFDGTALPSNLTSDTIPAIPGTPATLINTASGINPGSSPRITAIVTGSHPYAMVETGGVHEIKGIGDRIAGVIISNIDMSGIRLQNGARLSVDAGGQQ